MEDKDLQELIMIVKSCKNNLAKKYEGKYDEMVNKRCEEFCENHNIAITHGSAFKELRHKSYYYLDKFFESIINEHQDLYGFRKAHIVSDKEIVDYLLKQRG